MKHKLALVAITGLTVSVICLGAAAAIGGRYAQTGLDFDLFGSRPACAAVAGATATSRDIAWDGGDHVTIAVPARVQYSPQNGSSLHVTGDPQMLAHLRVQGGVIELDCRNFLHQRLHFDGDTLKMSLPGRDFRRFTIDGSGHLLLQNLKQPDLHATINGSGSITANGRVADLQIHIMGSGSADLGHVEARNAAVHIAGSGDADIAPTDEANIHIAGSGDVNLHTSPKKLETHITGSGRIRNIGPQTDLDKDDGGI
jgi:hypothetical protein